MRILIVATQIRLPGRHGGTTHVSELARNLGRYGEVLVMGQRGSQQRGVVGIGVPGRFPPWLNRGLAHLLLPGALKTAHTFRPDVIYERGSSYGLGALLASKLNIPMLCMVLDEHVSPRSLKRAEKIISTTESTVPAPYRDKFEKVSWGANAEHFSPDVAPVQSGLLPAFDGHTIGYVGSFKRWHGLCDLVEAAQRLKERKLRFLLVGDGPERGPLVERIAEAGLSDRFIFSGALAYEDVPRWVAAMDVCVAPFHPENHAASQGGFILDPLKVFEYLAMGKPTITVRSKNIESLLTHGEHLTLFESGNLDALIQAFESTLDDMPRARQMAEAGRELVLERHTWSAHAAHLHRLFEAMLEKRGA